MRTNLLSALMMLALLAGCVSPPPQAPSANTRTIPDLDMMPLATVRAVRGHARFLSPEKRVPQEGNVMVGMQFPEQTIFRTEPESQMDLFLGENGGLLRLTSSTEVHLKTMRKGKIGGKTVVHTIVELHKGRVLGNVKKLPLPSVYEIIVSPGYYSSRNSRYDLSDHGTVSVMEGSGEINYGETKRTLNAGQSFDPVTGKWH